MKVILASKSPRRREILEQMGFSFEIIPAVGEEIIQDTDPAKVVESLSAQKASEVAERCAESVESLLIIGSDTVVAKDGAILGKPKDEADAARMLRGLSGREHSVFTGVTLIYIEPGKEKTVKTFSEETKVSFYPMSEEEIQAYIASGEPMDKAGAYGIQGKAFVYIRGIEGDYYNVVGLPAARIYQELKKEQWI
jgi:septum formation protein